jgi:hypothetical protein
MAEPHQNAVDLDHTFAEAYQWLKMNGTFQLKTTRTLYSMRRWVFVKKEVRLEKRRFVFFKMSESLVGHMSAAGAIILIVIEHGLGRIVWPWMIFCLWDYNVMIMH